MSAACVSRRAFGTLPDGREVQAYTLDNGRGLALTAINLGGIVTELRCPDREGRSANVVLGFAQLDDYVKRNPHFGTIVGRCANRIAGGRFTLDGRVHQVGVNDGPNSLHGGAGGFGTRWWSIEPLPPQDDGSVALALAYDSADGEEGYPGALGVRVRYTLTPGGEWRIDYAATTSAPTIVNLTHHDYFNLAGAGSIHEHRLTLAASRFLSVDRHLIPEQAVEVAGTPFDFRQPTAIGARIREGHPQIVAGRGYDHHFVLDRAQAGLQFAARVEDPASGRVMEVHTTEPGVQFYSGNFLDATLLGSGGRTYRQGDALCLETQHHPDAANRADFPSTVLRPGETFTSCTVHRFTTR
jgi:aldose 1-epimerase